MSYAEDGYEIVPGIVAPGAADVLKQFVPASEAGFIPMAHDKMSWVLSLMKASQIVRKARECVGGEPVGLNSEYFHGRPNTKGFSIHQDNYFIQAPRGHLVSCWIALTDVERRNGALYVFPGSHKLGLLPIVAETPENRVNPCAHPGGMPVTCEMKKGDAIFMHGDLVHGSYINLSDRGRESLTIAYIRKGSPFRAGKYGRTEIDVT